MVPCRPAIFAPARRRSAWGLLLLVAVAGFGRPAWATMGEVPLIQPSTPQTSATEASQTAPDTESHDSNTHDPDTPDVATPDAVRRLLRQLEDSNFERREAAERALIDVGEPAFEAVASQAGRDGEQGERAFRVLSRWAFADRTLPTSAFTDRAERAIYALAEAGGVGGIRADRTLLIHSDVREQRGIAALEAHGVRFQYEDGFNRINLYDHGRRGDLPQRLTTIDFLPRYTGGVEGLWHLKRLSDIPKPTSQPAQVVRVSTRKLTRLQVDLASSVLSAPDVQIRGGSLGITGQNGGPCMVTAVTRGQAADLAGVTPGDVITKLDDTEIKTFGDLIVGLITYEEGDIVTLEVESFRGTRNVEVTLGGWDQMPGGVPRLIPNRPMPALRPGNPPFQLLPPRNAPRILAPKLLPVPQPRDRGPGEAPGVAPQGDDELDDF